MKMIEKNNIIGKKAYKQITVKALKDKIKILHEIKW